MISGVVNLRYVMEMLEIFPNQFEKVEVITTTNKEGIEYIKVHCDISNGCKAFDYINFGFNQTYNYFPNLGERSHKILPTIIIDMLIYGKLINIRIPLEDAKKDKDISKYIVYILEIIHRRLMTMEKQYYLFMDHRKYECKYEVKYYEKTLTLREIKNAQFLCSYIKNMVE